MWAGRALHLKGSVLSQHPVPQLAWGFWSGKPVSLKLLLTCLDFRKDL